jgi:hypothetical protein
MEAYGSEGREEDQIKISSYKMERSILEIIKETLDFKDPSFDRQYVTRFSPKDRQKIEDEVEEMSLKIRKSLEIERKWDHHEYMCMQALAMTVSNMTDEFSQNTGEKFMPTIEKKRLLMVFNSFLEKMLNLDKKSKKEINPYYDIL